MNTISKTTDRAFTFLSERMPLDFNLERIDWVVLLMDFQEKKGDEALEALAGAYVWAIDNLTGGKQSSTIKNFFAHDLNGRNDEHCLPRSSSYGKFWIEECKKRGWY